RRRFRCDRKTKATAMKTHNTRLTPTATIAALGMLTALAVTPASSTAAWLDSESARTAVTASTLETPSITSCDVRTLLGLGIVFTGVTITWNSAYGPSRVALRISGRTIPPSNITSTGSGPYKYTANLTDTLLSTGLGGLLGSSKPVEVIATYPDSAWVSPAATRTLRVGGLLGLAGPNNCT